MMLSGTEQRLSGGDPGLLRALNIDAVLRALRGVPALTRSEIGHVCGLSRQTVTVALDELSARGWVEELPPERSIGRPAQRFRFMSERAHVIGIDIGRSSLRMLLADLDGNVIGRRTEEMPRAGDALEACRTAARRFVEQQGGIAPTALCLGVPGVIDNEFVVRRSTTFPEWNGHDIRSRVRGWFDCSVTIENDANLAAIAEHWCGVAQGVDDVILLLTGRRTGASVILGGQLHRGHGGAAGEIAGLAILGWDGSDLAELAGHADDGAVFAAAEAGDAQAIERVDRFARTYAQGAAAMILTVNPDLLVLAGGISRAGETLAGPTRRHLQELCLDPPEVRASSLGVDAVAIGAVRRALDLSDQSLFRVPGALTR